MASGVKAMDTGAAETAAPEGTDEPVVAAEAPGRDAARRVGRTRGGRVRTVVLAVLAVLGIGGTVGFGLAWSGLHARAAGEAQARTAARAFLVDLTNFDAKTVDADFHAITSMATGPFAAQAQRFFNSAIRQELQKALASSRGQIRDLFVQSYGNGQAAVYGVVDQLYVNDKISSPQTDVLRLVVDLAQHGGAWKVADVTVLQGPSLAAPTSAKSSAGATAGKSASGAGTPGSGATKGG